MSVIAVRKYPNKILMSADKQTTAWHHKWSEAKDQMYVEPSKLWQHNDLVIGSAGWTIQSGLFRAFTKTHKPSSGKVEDILDFLVEFIDWAKKRDANFKLENHFIIIFEGKVFQTLGLDVKEVKEFIAVGSGMFLALAAMYKGSDPEEAVSIAKVFDLYCGGETDTIEVKLK